MGKDKASLNKWVELLSKHHKTVTIRRYFHKHRGSVDELYQLLLKAWDKRNKTGRLRGKIRSRNFKQLINFSTSFEPEKKAYKTKEGVLKTRRDVYIISLHDSIFDEFFKSVYIYFSDSVINDTTFMNLELILKEYYDEYTKIKKLKNLSSKDSIVDKEKDINKILDQTEKILLILNLENDLHLLIPTVKIRILSELNKETTTKLKELGITPSSTYAELLKCLRNI